MALEAVQQVSRFANDRDSIARNLESVADKEQVVILLGIKSDVFLYFLSDHFCIFKLLFLSRPPFAKYMHVP